jgi:uncharacterized protein (DUF983 family)
MFVFEKKSPETTIARNVGVRKLDLQAKGGTVVAEEKSIKTGLIRGLSRRCPVCGKGRLLRGYLTIRRPCEVCGSDNTIYPSDDLPPYLTVFIVGHVMIASVVWADSAFSAPLWLESAVSLPVTAILCLALLPFMKGATVGICWATNITRGSAAT